MKILCIQSLPIALLLLISIGISPASYGAEPDEVIIVANSASRESVEIANYYSLRRRIPDKNLILLETPLGETIDRQTYLDQIANPLLQQLIQRGHVNAVADDKDELGRLKPIVFKTNFKYIVLCYGIPVRISEVAELDDSPFLHSFFKTDERPPVANGPLSKNAASVDGELATLILSRPPLSGFIPNPYYNKSKFTRADVLKVTRLDGPSAQSVRKMIQNAIEGENKGLRGRAYVDEDTRTGGYQQGNDWLREVAEIFEKLNYSLEHNTENRLLGPLDRFDAPVLYAGWYTMDVSYPFDREDFKFPPGAVAVHLHSASASPLRSSNKRWVGPFVERGVSATVGNTSEPYLTLTHNFNILFKALSQGMNFGDAAYMALPGVSWQGVAIGDPLFTPFKKSLDEQLKDTGNPSESFLDQYVYIRAMNEDRSPRTIAQRGMFMSPGPALALAQANIESVGGFNEVGLKSIRLFRNYEISSATEWVLFEQLAEKADELKDPTLAYTLYRNLLSEESVPKPLRKRWLTAASQIARRINEFRQAIEWEEALKQLDPPPPPPAPPEESVSPEDGKPAENESAVKRD